jgi:hypothetical protein
VWSCNAPNQIPSFGKGLLILTKNQEFPLALIAAVCKTISPGRSDPEDLPDELFKNLPNIPDYSDMMMDTEPTAVPVTETIATPMEIDPITPAGPITAINATMNGFQDPKIDEPPLKLSPQGLLTPAPTTNAKPVQNTVPNGFSEEAYALVLAILEKNGASMKNCRRDNQDEECIRAQTDYCYCLDGVHEKGSYQAWAERGIQIFPHKGVTPYCYAGWPKETKKPNCMKSYHDRVGAKKSLSWDITQEELKVLFPHIVFTRKRPAEENPEVIAKKQSQECCRSIVQEA